MKSKPEPRSDRGFAFPAPAMRERESVPPFPTLSLGKDELWILAIGLGVLYVAAILFSQSGAARTDEIYHFAQIELFRHGEFRVLDRYLTTIPGYHAVVATLLKLTGSDSLGAARTITALFGLLAAAAFHMLRRQTQPGSEALATAQFLALPVLAPFFFLVYTDVLALALVLWATVATTRDRHWLAAIAMCGALLVRQNDVVWAGFLAALAAWPEFREQRFSNPKRLLALVVPYLVPVAAFLAFWAWNGSISLSHEQAALHPELSFHSGNLLFGLGLAGFLLLPQGAKPSRDVRAAARARPWLLIVMLVAFIAFQIAFSADNPYNAAMPAFYIHNAIVQALLHNRDVRLLGAAGAMSGVAVLIMTRLRPPAAAWLFPIAALALASEWLVEPRYMIIPLALWLAFREMRSKTIEYVTLALWAALAVWIFAGMISGRLFP
jgi:alpha-1,2-glucosyltransferase